MQVHVIVEKMYRKLWKMAKKAPDGGIVLSALEEDLLTLIRCYSNGVYGLKILKDVNEANEKVNRRKVRIGSLYPALKRMENQGLIEGQWGADDGATGGGRRRYYTITGTGKKALNDTWIYRRELADVAAGECNESPAYT